MPPLRTSWAQVNAAERCVAPSVAQAVEHDVEQPPCQRGLGFRNALNPVNRQLSPGRFDSLGALQAAMIGK
jgi:hypothetical protein